MKFRITMTIVREYEPNSEYYDDIGPDLNDAQMLAVDVQGAEEDPYLFMDNTHATMTVTGEIVP